MELYATGEGQTQAPLAVGIGGQEAEVLESDAFPGFVEFLRVKVHIPKEVAPGPAVPSVLSIGEARSQDGVASRKGRSLEIRVTRGYFPRGGRFDDMRSRFAE